MHSTKTKIIEYIKERGQVTASQLSGNFNISRQMVHRYLLDLVEKNYINKVGKPPRVYYLLNEDNKETSENVALEREVEEKINKNYLIITPDGKKMDGVDGFIYWCKKQNLDISKTAKEYIKTIDKYDAYKLDGLIDGENKMRNSFNNLALDKTLYLDFYSIERFGKTRLGQLLLYAKQSQNRTLIKELVSIIKPQIEKTIKKYNIDGIAFIPPTVKREVQFMKELEGNLDLKISKLNLVKIKSEIMIPQKTLSNMSDRIDNAKKTIFIDNNFKFRNLLLIDDAVGSGATLNETAKKIKKQKLSKKIIGLAITGSFKGFDVISEV
ncbi:MAG: winged helix-turn-helix transcriptional regulator [Patescibacteria group bacterium]|jgi:phosphoribosylpyrophosphate synthetase|nr:winged helix-turn-helix transcriptional regulator [Patescibacteria group bacterium]